MNRRVFLLQSAAGLLLACSPRLGRRDARVICVEDVLGPLAGVPEELAVLGEAFLDAHREENDGEALVDAVFGASAGEPLSDGLLAGIAEEHASGDVVQVDGWRLARTEARLAALVYLSQQC